MKIVHINATCETGSTGSIVKQLRDYAIDKGHKVQVFYGADRYSYEGAVRIGSRPGQVLHALKSRLTGMQGYSSRLATRELLRQLAYFEPDVVHLHNLHANYVNLPMLLGYLAKYDVATVLTLHDCWFFTGKCTYPVQTGCRKWAEGGCRDCPQLRIDNVNPTWFFDRTQGCFEDKMTLFEAIPRLGVVGVSDWITDEARRSFLAARNPIRIYNWVDRAVFQPRPAGDVTSLRRRLGISPDEKMVLFVSSNLSERKGYNVLSSLPEYLDESSKVVYVGGNKSSLPLPSEVVAPGPARSQKELALFYSAADVCVNTTKCETFGLVTAEALACGTPVIVNPNTASPEIVENGCGFVLKAQDDAREVARLIEVLASQNRVAIRGKCVASSRRFDMRESLSHYLNLYERISVLRSNGKQCES
ncbi:glycosyltransferase [Collinsella tanakaei]|nr:glycosyltransferase [Collinsella tanakaei]